MRRISAFAAGLLFGFGLLISDMVNPARVLAFLDIFGAWDPTLAFVMGGALIVSTGAWAVARRRSRAVLGGPLPPAPQAEIDRPLIAGSALFGIGWGLVGICPGPGLVALGFGGWEVVVFFVAMLAGMALYRLLILPRLAPV